MKYLRGTRSKFPTPVSSKSISKFADQKCLESGLEEFPAELGGGAQFNPATIVDELISTLPTPPSHIHLQILGDGFRAMKSASIVSVGARLLVETEEESGDTSFTALASL